MSVRKPKNKLSVRGNVGMIACPLFSITSQKSAPIQQGDGVLYFTGFKGEMGF